MITGFEEITHELTDEELEISKIIIRGIQSNIGSDNAITNIQIRKILLEKYEIKINDARIRKIINHIRVKRLVPKLCAASKGYYIAATKEEHQKYIESLQERIHSIQNVLSTSKLDFLKEW